MLVPPQKPMLRQPNQAAWLDVCTTPFDGAEKDHFSRTTLHLSFTEYNPPIYDGVRGGQDSQVFFLESIISVHDKGDWVGDIDILTAVESFKVERLSPPAHCSHEQGSKLATNNMMSVECWDDVLELPRNKSVIRASGNWAARLAATAVVVQILPEEGSEIIAGQTLLICPSSVCWNCVDPKSLSSSSEQHFSRQLSARRRVYLY